MATNIKINKRVLFTSVLLGFLVGLVDTVLDYKYFYKSKGFLNLLIFDVPEHEIYIRFTILLCFVVIGIIAGNSISLLQDALQDVKVLKGFLPICAQCKNIRDDQGYWNKVEKYISCHSEAIFTHGICPKCANDLYPDLYNEVVSSNDNN
jgi:hypothetical protein